MVGELLRLIPYALVAALSPTAFAATLAVIASGRLKALGFGIGFVAGQVLALAVLLWIGSAALPQRDTSYPKVEAVLEFALAAGLLWLAARVRRRVPRASHGQSERTRKVLARLGRMRVVTAVAGGVLLGIGAKRLVLSALAAGSIAASGVGSGSEGTLVGWYTLLATSVVWIPVAVFVLFGEKAVAWLAATQARLVQRQSQVVFFVLVIMAALLVVDGVITLL